MNEQTNTTINRPIATEEISGTPVRFFKAPLPIPHLPWHSLDDLHRAMRFPRALRKQMLEMSRAFPGGDFITVSTSDGPVVIGSHPMAQGVIGAAVEVHGLRAGFERDYAKAAAAAMDALTGELDAITKVNLLLEAARNTLGLGRVA